MDTILGILSSERYSGIRAFVNLLSVCVKYTNSQIFSDYFVSFYKFFSNMSYEDNMKTSLESPFSNSKIDGFS